MPQPKQPVTDDSVQVRQLSHYQFTWVAGEPNAPGTCELPRVRWRQFLLIQEIIDISLLVLRWGESAAGRVQSRVVEPVDPFQRR